MEQDLKFELNEKYGQTTDQADRANKEGYKSLEEIAEELRKTRTLKTDLDKQEQVIEDEFETATDGLPPGGEHAKPPPSRDSAPPKIEV